MDLSVSKQFKAAAFVAENDGDYSKAVQYHLKAIENLSDVLFGEGRFENSTLRRNVHFEIKNEISRVKLLISIMKTEKENKGTSVLRRTQSWPSLQLSSKGQLDATMPVANTKSQSKTTVIPENLKQSNSPKSLVELLHIKKPNISWETIIGMQSAKTALREAVLIPLLYPNTPQARNAWNGILLFGPSGVGKTQLIKAVATEMNNVTLFNLTPDVVLSRWLGETEKAITKVFEIARQQSPSIIFMDEVDSLCGARHHEDNDCSRRLKNVLLMQMDGMMSNSEANRVLVIGMTNHPEFLDTAFLRRFQKRIFVPLPIKEERVLLLKQFMSDYGHSVTEEELIGLAEKVYRFTGSDIKTLVTKAGLVAASELTQSLNIKKAMDLLDSGVIGNQPKIRPLTIEDMETALKETKISNSSEHVSALDEWNMKYGDGRYRSFTEETSAKMPWHWLMSPLEGFFSLID